MGAMGMNLTTGQALPPMTGFDANAVAQALAQSGVGNNAPSGVRPGVPAGAMQNPLAQMLAGQRETYQPSDTTWGIKGDRLLRFTPQEGNQRGGGTGGTGGLPAINAGEDSMAYMLRIGMSQADADKALAISKANPGMSFQDIMAQMRGGAGGGVLPGSSPNDLASSINWGQVGAQLNDKGVPVPLPAPSPTGAPAINTAMDKLKGTGLNAEGKYAGAVPTTAEVNALRDAWKAIANAPAAERRAPDWYARKTAAEQAYLEAQKRTGYGPGGYTLG
jgi:hypothetical protein